MRRYTQRHLTTREQLIDLIMESGLLPDRSTARAACRATCTAIRAWALAATSAPRPDTAEKLSIPGVGSLRVTWHSFNNYADRCFITYGPHPSIRAQLRANNKAAYKRHYHIDKPPAAIRRRMAAARPPALPHVHNAPTSCPLLIAISSRPRFQL
jgi:hypothetical protein